MSQFLIIIVILLLICAEAVTLWLDARQKRIDRQLAIALPTSLSASLPSIRRLEAGSRWLFLHRLANYRAGMVYDWHPAYVLLAGAIAAAAVFYANTLLGFSTLPSCPLRWMMDSFITKELSWPTHEPTRSITSTRSAPTSRRCAPRGRSPRPSSFERRLPSRTTPSRRTARGWRTNVAASSPGAIAATSGGFRPQAAARVA